MGPGTCWRCLAPTREAANIQARPRLRVLPFNLSQSTASISTTAGLSYPPPKLSRPNPLAPATPFRGAKKIFIKKKKKDVETKGRPVAPGERKAFRKRIVLSNTNALEVTGMRDLSAETMVDENTRGKVVGIPGLVVDQLRAIEAFKVSQGWGYFRRPGTLVREETVQYGHLFQKMSDQHENATVRRVLVGERASGKSTLLLQAMSMAFVRQWVVINIPEAQDLSIGHTEYGPLPGTSPTQYIQKVYLASLLSRIARANPLLSTLQISQSHSLPIPLQPNISLDRLALLGASDPEISHAIFMALWVELTTPSTPEHPRPKILLTLDGLAHIMKSTAYLSAQLTAIHAHDLTLVKWFLDYLSGFRALPNGGMVLVATSESNHPRVETLRLRLVQLEALQDPSRRILHSAIQPFLDATGQEHSQIPQLDPFVNYDERVLDTFKDEEKGIKVQRLKGLNMEEARGLMEYWAKSGMMRAKVSEGLVGEKWTLSGGGLVGELEKGCVRLRV
ncbi:37S ribosomal protein S23 mitochondrial [Trapelia coarctata]|nr:37S ribosomal protein S23 mitochondrial [Trapelia coarctata]